MSDLWRAIITEFIGTFVLVFIGASTVAQGVTGWGNSIAAALAFGITMMVLLYFWWEKSHQFNPVLTLAAALDGRISWGCAIGYWIAQFLGAIAAGALVMYIYGSASGVGVSVGTLTYTDAIKAIVVEGLLTMILTLGFLFVTKNESTSMVCGFVIGGLLLVCMMAGFSLTGASLNPARSLGPAVFNKSAIGSIWIYFVGPFAGGIVAFLVYKCLTMHWRKTMHCDVVDKEVDVYVTKETIMEKTGRTPSPSPMRRMVESSSSSMQPLKIMTPSNSRA